MRDIDESVHEVERTQGQATRIRIDIQRLCLPAGYITITDRVTMIDDLKAVGELFDIKLLDHITFNAKGYHSFLEDDGL